MVKKIKRNIGDIVKIDIGDGQYCFACILDEPLVAFFDIKTDLHFEIEEIVQKPILFKIWVMNNAVTSGHWPIVGTQVLFGDLLKPTKFFRQDIISKKLFICTDSIESPATREECENLECAAVWSYEHVEDRLRDHFSGIPSLWVKSLEIK
ncbi:MAG: immunity 26/phosphotriesterase HocA family protein [Saccharospirillaceae bacterium]|nr:immunity 26/phosphotriesterase HocA family protein [Pseudomonadales bacterium]NRB81651.1 immunity 26/phosphotriesterase HocA family protein [Saccharospirillaceae bacterium]